MIAPTTVRDRNGEFVNGLQLQDFELYDNNKLQKVTRMSETSRFRWLWRCSAAPTSPSSCRRFRESGRMLNQLLAGQDGEMAVVGFDHRIQVMQDFTNEGTKISEAMKKMTPGSSNHAVIDAVDQSIRMLKNRPRDRRRVLLLIAEKRDRGSELRLREALTEAQFANVSIYSLDISTSRGRPYRQGHAAASAAHSSRRAASCPAVIPPLPPPSIRITTTAIMSRSSSIFSKR